MNPFASFLEIKAKIIESKRSFRFQSNIKKIWNQTAINNQKKKKLDASMLTPILLDGLGANSFLVTIWPLFKPTKIPLLGGFGAISHLPTKKR